LELEKAIAYFKKIKDYDPDDFELKIPRKTFEKLDSDFRAFCRIVEYEYLTNLTALKIPQGFLENRVQVLGLWKDENALSDNLVSLLFQRGIIKNNNILRKFLDIFYPGQALYEFQLENISREPSYKVNEKVNRGDILIRLSKGTKTKQILIEHKIYHELSTSQLRKYQSLSLAEDTDLIILSSKDKDFEVSSDFKNASPGSSGKDIFHVTHLALLEILLNELRDNPQTHFGFLAKWLFEIVYAFRFQECITPRLDFLPVGDSEFEKKKFFTLLIKEN